jgi:hypothetical protein
VPPSDGMTSLRSDGECLPVIAVCFMRLPEYGRRGRLRLILRNPTAASLRNLALALQLLAAPGRQA